MVRIPHPRWLPGEERPRVAQRIGLLQIILPKAIGSQLVADLGCSRIDGAKRNLHFPVPDFRLLVDRTLSEIYSSQAFASLYAKWCGPFDDDTRAFFEWVTLMP